MRHGGDPALDLADLAIDLAVDVDGDCRRRAIHARHDPIVIDTTLAETRVVRAVLRGAARRSFRMTKGSSPRAGCSSTGRYTRSKQRGPAMASWSATCAPANASMCDERTIGRRKPRSDRWCPHAGCTRRRDDTSSWARCSAFGPGRRAVKYSSCATTVGWRHEICEYVAALRQPPHFETRESEAAPCRARSSPRVPIMKQAAQAGARRGTRTSPTTSGSGRRCTLISDDERVVRAQLTLGGDTLTVSTQSAAARQRRVLAGLTPRSPIWRSCPTYANRSDAGETPWPDEGKYRGSLPLDPAVARHRSSTRWSSGGSGTVPALGRGTPVEAAADPTVTKGWSGCSPPSPNRPTGRS